jgi:hypothetical protein
MLKGLFLSVLLGGIFVLLYNFANIYLQAVLLLFFTQQYDKDNNEP